MTDVLTPDLCVVGAGSGGLSVAAGAVQMGASVVLLEKGEMGGDCLNTGCVPSKALIAAAHRAHDARTAAPFGVTAAPEVDYAQVHAHMRSVIDGIAPHDSQERFEELGVHVIRAHGAFISPREMTAGGITIRPHRFILATGSSPAVPPIPGLADTPYLTNETLFDLTVLPEKLIIIGGGPIGLEMAQSFARLGSQVTVLEAATLLSREDPELTAPVAQALREEGVDLRVGVAVSAAASTATGVQAILADGTLLDGTHLLVAAGRKPNVGGLNLEAAGAAYDAKGLTVDARLRSVSNKRVFAVGDVAGGPQFTHAAGYHAGVVIRNTLFRMSAKARVDHLPRACYTDPEVASVGLTEAEARAKHGDAVLVLRWPFAENDRARADRATAGLVKLIATKRGHILGAGIVGPHAGEQIHIWALAVSKGLKIKDVASYVPPYPTLGEAGKRAAGQFYTPKLFSARTRLVVRTLAKLG